MEGVPPDIDELAAEAIEDYGQDSGEGEPLLGPVASNNTDSEHV